MSNFILQSSIFLYVAIITMMSTVLTQTTFKMFNENHDRSLPSRPYKLRENLAEHPPNNKMQLNLTNFQNTQYYAKVAVGSPPQELTVVLDTGSSVCILSVASSYGYRYYGFLQLNYGVGSAQGEYVYDLLNLTEGARINMSFISIDKTKDFDDLQADGLLGLTNDIAVITIIDLLFENGFIQEKLFTFSFDYVENWNTSVSNNSYMTIGHIPEHSVNNVIWFPVLTKDNWCIEIIGMRVNEDYIDISKVGSSKNTLFDTGNSAIVLCEPVHNAVFKILQKNGCFKNEQSELLCWCEDQDIENYPNISFYSRGVKTDVTPEFYLINPSIDPESNKKICTVALSGPITAYGVPYGNQVLGDPFFRGNLVVFSKGNQTMGITGKRTSRTLPVNFNVSFWTGIFGTIIILASIVLVLIMQSRFVFIKEDDEEVINLLHETELSSNVQKEIK